MVVQILILCFLQFQMKCLQVHDVLEKGFFSSLSVYVSLYDILYYIFAQSNVCVSN